MEDNQEVRASDQSYYNQLYSSYDDIIDYINNEPDPELRKIMMDSYMEEQYKKKHDQKIEDLKLNGKALHKTFFFSDKCYHDFINLYKIDSKFKFDIKGLTGQCVISVGFPDYGHTKSPETEMEVNILQGILTAVEKNDGKNK